MQRKACRASNWSTLSAKNGVQKIRHQMARIMHENENSYTLVDAKNQIHTYKQIYEEISCWLKGWYLWEAAAEPDVESQIEGKIMCLSN